MEKKHIVLNSPLLHSIIRLVRLNLIPFCDMFFPQKQVELIALHFDKTWHTSICETELIYLVCLSVFLHANFVISMLV